MESLRQVDGSRAVVVVRGGSVVAERHWSRPPETLHHVWSVTKSVTSTLVGIVQDRGDFSDLGVAMVDYLPPHLVVADPAKDDIQLLHLLTMTSGLEWVELEDWYGWQGSANPAQLILSRPLATTPGEVFLYSTGASHLPSVMLAETVGVPTEVFAAEHLFEPLGITSWHWDGDPQGYPFGGHGLWLRTEDVAKLGLLFLRRGSWGGQQVVSLDWSHEATRSRFDWNITYGPLEDVGYGYLWWTARAGGYRVYTAWGWGGQFSFCVPELDLVVATAAHGDVLATQADAQERAILHVIVDEILPTMGATGKLPRRPEGRQRLIRAGAASSRLHTPTK